MQRPVLIAAAVLLLWASIPEARAIAVNGTEGPTLGSEEARAGVTSEPTRVDVTSRTTQSLYAACLAEEASPSGWCSTYLLGVADTLTAFGAGGHRGGIGGVDYTIEQLAETF